MKTVAIIGAGRVGGAVGHLLARAGYSITAVMRRTQEAASSAVSFIGSGRATTDAAEAARSAEIVLITTPDGAIRSVCESIGSSGGFRKGALVLHLSGAHSLDLLDAAREAGALRAVIHPLQSVPSREQGIGNIPGSFFRIEADPAALPAARDMVKALGGIELMMPKWSTDRESASLYHAGAVAVSNYFVALVDYGLAFYQVLGADKQEALKAVLPLVKGTLANIERLGTTEALTGPISRGDTETIKGHLDAMRKRAPELLPLYRGLAKRTIKIAGERGLPDAKVRELLQIIEE
ncbi:MAG: DUF2520 domain-containing protein [Nitrospiraceae bacterium]|nr:DUF2520 domain-containing protein [Nitrospiraceae bacterium]